MNADVRGCLYESGYGEEDLKHKEEEEKTARAAVSKIQARLMGKCRKKELAGVGVNWGCQCMRCRSLLQEVKLSLCGVENFNDASFISKKLLTLPKKGQYVCFAPHMDKGKVKVLVRYFRIAKVN